MKMFQLACSYSNKSSHVRMKDFALKKSYKLKKTWKWLIKFSCNSIDFDSSVTIFENEKGTFTSVS